MVVLFTSKIDGDTIQNEGAIVFSVFSPLSVHGKISVAQGQETLKLIVRTGLKSNPLKIL